MVASKHISKQRGFILAATLWALAIMFVAVGFFHAYVQRKMTVGLQAKAHLEQSLDQVSTEQTLMYLLNTNRMTRSGLTFKSLPPVEDVDSTEVQVSPIDTTGDELFLDDTAYQGIGDTFFSIQDATGLVDVNEPELINLERLLNQLEPDPAQRTRLLSSLVDYIDSDDLINLGGAETRDYLIKGMTPPTNDYLRSPVELQNVYGWREWLAVHPQIDVARWFSTTRAMAMNVNSMSKNMLVWVLGMKPEDAEKYILERRTNPAAYISELSARYPIPEQPEMEMRYRAFPSRLLRLSFWGKGGGQAKMISLQLTPNGLQRPWQVDYEYSVESVNHNNEPLAVRQSNLFH